MPAGQSTRANWRFRCSAGACPYDRPDWVIGDADGVVVVPAERLEQTLQVAERLLEVEAGITGAVMRGEDLGALLRTTRSSPASARLASYRKCGIGLTDEPSGAGPHGRRTPRIGDDPLAALGDPGNARGPTISVSEPVPNDRPGRHPARLVHRGR